MTILGIDISKWDGNWDATKAKTAGATFVFIKASQATFTDPQFSANWQKAKAAGLLRGAYHYLDYTKPGIEQANYFADLLKNDPGELPPVIDYELRRTDNNPSAALGFLRDCLDQLIKRTELYKESNNKRPMIYTGPGFWTEYGDVTKSDYWIQFPLWNAHWTTSASPLIPAPWTMWQFWQFSSKGPGEAFGSESLAMDMDRFNGTLSELMEFAGIQIPVVNINEQIDALNGKVSKLEGIVAALDQVNSPVKGIVSRVDNLEGQFSDIEGSISSLATTITQRINGMELILTNLKNASTVRTSPIAIPADTRKMVITKPDPVISDPLPAEPVQEMAQTSVTPVLTGQVSEPVTFATCITSALNVRNGPAVTYPKVAGLQYGQQVKVINRHNGWAQFEKPSGWSSEAYLTFNQINPPEQQVNPEAPTVNATFGICNTSGLNVRSGPGATHPIVGGLTYGQRIKIIGHKTGWAQIESPSGWCNETYLSFA